MNAEFVGTDSFTIETGFLQKSFLVYSDPLRF